MNVSNKAPSVDTAHKEVLTLQAITNRMAGAAWHALYSMQLNSILTYQAIESQGFGRLSLKDPFYGPEVSYHVVKGAGNVLRLEALFRERDFSVVGKIVFDDPETAVRQGVLELLNYAMRLRLGATDFLYVWEKGSE